MAHDREATCDHVVIRTKNQTAVSLLGTKTVQLGADLLSKGRVLDPSTFDIVLGSQLTTAEWPDATAILQFARHLLIPGGALILEHPNIHKISLDDFYSSTVYSQESTTPILFSQSRPLCISDILTAEMAPPPEFLTFEVGKELEMRTRLDDRDNSQPLWIESTFDVHGAAAQGFTRCLRKELAHPVHLVLFASCWDTGERLTMMRQLAQLPHLEDEIIIDSQRTLLVPRLCRASPPPVNTLDVTEYWTQDDSGNYIHPPLPIVPADNIAIRVTATFPLPHGFSAVAGDIFSTKSSSWTEGQRVLGISTSPLSNFCVGHAGTFVKSSNAIAEATLLPFLGGIVVAILGFGMESLRRPERLEGKRVAVTNSDEAIGRFLVQFLDLVGLEVHQVPNDLSIHHLELVQSCHFTFSGFIGEQRQLLSRVSEASRTIYWQDENSGLPALMRSENWTIFDDVTAFIGIHEATLTSMASLGDIREPSSLIDPQKSVDRHGLFDPSEVYMLIGGIGSLGLHIALWMYTVSPRPTVRGRLTIQRLSQKGARKLVLTSRSGRQSLIKHNDVMALRILSYLETLDDLSLTLAACDASSPKETAKCIAKIDGSIRGIILLSVQLSDGTFAKHSKDTYETPFAAKQGALFALEKCLALKNLDFLISMSSATIFGNAGQTNYARWALTLFQKRELKRFSCTVQIQRLTSFYEIMRMGFPSSHLL